MDNSFTTEGLIRDIIQKELKYYKHYLGKVVNNVDPTNRGGVVVVVEELGWNNPATGAWAFPRQMHGFSAPNIDEWVEIYFLEGDVSKCVYLGLASERMPLPKGYDGLPTTHIIFQDPISGAYIKYDGVLQTFEIAVLNTATKVIIDATGLSSTIPVGKTGLNTHLHGTGVGPSTPPTPNT